MQKTKTISEFNPNAVEVKPDTGLNDNGKGPGDSFKEGQASGLEWLGNLNMSVTPENKDEEGQGDHVVILFDAVTGPNSTAYSKGQVVRMSKVIANFGNDRHIEQARSAAQRLFAMKAIRLASSDEIREGFVELTKLSQSDEALAVQQRMIKMERENENLRSQLLMAQAAKDKASPNATANSATGKNTSEAELPSNF